MEGGRKKYLGIISMKFKNISIYIYRKKSGQRRAGGNGYTDEEESDASLMMSQGGR
jgi:hypothetical protein